MQMTPVAIAHILALGRRGRLSWIAIDPFFLNKVIELLGPACGHKDIKPRPTMMDIPG